MYAFLENPIYAGFYRIGGEKGFCVMIPKKPNWFHRKMVYICLGWKWIDV